MLPGHYIADDLPCGCYDDTGASEITNRPSMPWKSLGLCVTSGTPRCNAVAAIHESANGSGRPARRIAATRRAPRRQRASSG